MPENKELVEDENNIDTVISNDINFSGSLKFKKSLKIKGNFEGKIETDGHLIVGREAKVTADIRAGVVSVSGIINGKIKTDQKIELYNKSKISCDLVTPDLFMESGSQFNGTCIMKEKKLG